MNASQLYKDEYYAWRKNPPKGKVPLDAVKVRLRHTEQRKVSYMKNRSTFAAVTAVDSGREYTVPAREIIMFWDDYEAEREHLHAEKIEAEKRSRRHTLRRHIVQSMVNYRLQEKGIPLVAEAYGTTVGFDASTILAWLEITEDAISEAIERVIEQEYGSPEET